MFGKAVVTEGHFDVLNDNISGTRSIDEHTFVSVAVLADRLDRLQRTNPMFADVSFSPEVEDLVHCESISGLC
ncbi:MAG: hypothetical protein KAJ07_06855 [Planctomycetes bacterium]|nr:hypothetical protein [Planctomycetota bacterium]MCK5564951.1 hypothetical protein [Planctomycetota bacterium]